MRFVRPALSSGPLNRFPGNFLEGARNESHFTFEQGKGFG
jgi:hypothetical protein